MSITKAQILDTVYSNPSRLKYLFNLKESKELIYDKSPYYIDYVLKYKLYHFDNKTLSLKKYYEYNEPYITYKKEDKITISSDKQINSSIISTIIEDLYKRNRYGLEGIIRSSVHFINTHVNKSYYCITEDQSLSITRWVSWSGNTILTTLYSGAINFQTMATRDSIIASVLIQIFSNLKYLKTIGFRSNSLTVDRISVIEKNISINYSGISHKTNFLLRIGGFENSELTFNYKNTIYNIRQENETNNNLIFEKNLNGDYILKPWEQFRVGPRIDSDIPRDWDAITFIISFLTIPEVYYSVITNTGLYNKLMETFHLRGKIRIKKFLKESIKKGRVATYLEVVNIMKGVFFIPGLIDRVCRHYSDEMN